jgi:hypothetical protein
VKACPKTTLLDGVQAWTPGSYMPFISLEEIRIHAESYYGGTLSKWVKVAAPSRELLLRAGVEP